MTLPHLEARFRAVETLQTLLPRHPPGSARYRIIERALDLVFNESRVVDTYLIRNLLRDARRTLDRQAQAGLILSLSAEPGDIDHLSDVDLYLADESQRPDLLLEAKQLALRALARTAARSSSAARVFEGLITGEPLRVTAEACGISAARVNQVRHEIRVSIADMVEVDHVH